MPRVFLTSLNCSQPYEQLFNDGKMFVRHFDPQCYTATGLSSRHFDADHLSRVKVVGVLGTEFATPLTTSSIRTTVQGGEYRTELDFIAYGTNQDNRRAREIELVGKLTPPGIEAGWERGFIASIRATAATWTKWHFTLLQDHTVSEVLLDHSQASRLARAAQRQTFLRVWPGIKLLSLPLED